MQQLFNLRGVTTQKWIGTGVSELDTAVQADMKVDFHTRKLLNRQKTVSLPVAFRLRQNKTKQHSEQ